MVTKTFGNTINFYEQNVNGRIVSLPLVQVNIIKPNGNSFALSLLFDTGASFTTLRADCFPLLGLNSWDEGQAIPVNVVGGTITNYQYQATLELFGKRIDCPIHLSQMSYNPLFSGLLGRDTIFEEFGFGFWESAHELYISENP